MAANSVVTIATDVKAIAADVVLIGTAMAERNPAKDKKLSNAEAALVDAEAIKQDILGRGQNAHADLYKDKDGNIYIKPKGGNGPGEPTGLNIKDF